MIRLERTSVMNLENAMRGARNPMNSWSRMDSYYDEDGRYHLGPNDLDLAKRLCRSGSDHRKFLRQVFVSVDITAPLYWWKEYDTYKVATVANYTSTMHRIHRNSFELEDFSCDQMTDETREFMELVVARLEQIRLRYLETKSRRDWYDLIQLLPSEREGIEIDLESSVARQFGEQIKKIISSTLNECGITDVRVKAVDKGALDCTIRARVTAAAVRATGNDVWKD